MQKKYTFYSLLVFFLIITFTATNQVWAGAEDRFKGYAWSDNIGWISFNCYDNTTTPHTNDCGTSEYGVDLNSTNELTGEAWSDNIGWISFDYCHTSGDCVGPTFNNSTKEIAGDVFVLSSVGDPSWDGIISLAGTISGGGGSYVPILVNNFIEGFSWGSLNIGWISWNCSNTNSCGSSDYKVELDPFKFNFTAAQGLDINNKISNDGSVRLEWQTVGNVNSCTPTGGDGTNWTTNNLPRDIGQPTRSFYLVENLTNPINNFSLTCTDDLGNNITRDLTIYVKSPQPTFTFSTPDDNIGRGTPATLNWTSTYMSSCSIDQGIGNVTPRSGGSVLSSNLVSDTDFKLTCIPADTTDYPSNFISEPLTIFVEKMVMNFSAVRDRITFNDRFELNWSLDFAADCLALSRPSLPGKGGGLSSNFNGPVDEGSGEHTFISAPIGSGARSYIVSLTCSDINGHNPQTTKIKLRVGKNPIFIEN